MSKILLLPIIFCMLLYAVGFAQTNNMNFEDGNFNGWTLEVGRRIDANTEDYTQNIGVDIDEHIRLMNPNVPPLDEYALVCGTVDIPTIFPGGVYSARIGNNPGGVFASKISRTFTVDPNQAYLQYSYAIILEEPGHSEEDQPKFVVNIKDSNGDIVTCGKFEAFAGPNALSQGFLACDLDRQYRCDFPLTECADSPQFSWPIQILPWTSGGADLTPFVGQQITVEFIALDCLLGAHGATAYLEANIEPLEIIVGGLCAEGDTITLTAPIGFVSYLWSTGETTRTITVDNAMFGDMFTVQLVSNTGCDTETSIVLEPQPDAAIDPIPDQTICRGANAIVVPSGNNAGLFYFVEPDFTGLSYVYTPNVTTTYTVIALNDNGCQGESTTFTINVLDSDGPTFPEALFEQMPILDADGSCNTVQFTNLSGYCKEDLTYEWDFGDGSPLSTDENPLHTFPTTATPQIYTITLTVTSASDGLMDSYSETFNSGGISPSFEIELDCEVATITNTSMVCNMLYNTIPNAGVYTYTWDFGDGSAPVVNDQETFTFSYTTSGTYQVRLTLTDTDTGTPYTFETFVEATVGLQSNFEFSTNNCFTVQFRDLSTFCDPIVDYLWNFGDGSTSTEMFPDHTFPDVGPYTVTLTVNDGTSSDTSSQEVTLNPQPTTVGFTYEQLCETLSFNDTSTSCASNLSYSWDFDDGGTGSTEQNPTRIFEFGNTYTVVLTINDGLRDYTFSEIIDVEKEFVYNTPQDSQVCSAPGSMQGEFNLDTQTREILANVPPFTQDPPVVTFHLTENEAFNASNPISTNYISTESSQEVYARVEEGPDCFEIFSFTLFVDITPEINTIEDIFLCSVNTSSRQYDLSQLNARFFEGTNQEEITLTYHENDADAQNNDNPINRITLIAGMTTTIYARVENEEQRTCFSVSQFNLRLDNQDTDNEARCLLTFSNTMTPNGDGANDTFVIENIDAFPKNLITIYNRWGNLVYQTTGYNNGWDGTHNGKPLPVATYYYVLELNDTDNQIHSGYITVLR